MKKSKRCICVILVAVLALSLLGCSSIRVGRKTISEEEVAIEEIPTEDIIKNSEEKIRELVDSLPYVEIGELDIYEDKLLMEEKMNKKKYNNIIIEVVLILSNDFDIGDTDKITREYADAIIEEFRQREAENFRISKIDINYKRQGQTGVPMGGRGTNYSPIYLGEELGSLKLDQDEEDFKAQTIAYDYLEGHEEIDLMRIGIENGNFIIGLRVFDLQEEEFESKAEEISEDLAQLILEDNQVKEYLIEKNIKDINLYWIYSS